MLNVDGQLCGPPPYWGTGDVVDGHMTAQLNTQPMINR